MIDTTRKTNQKNIKEKVDGCSEGVHEGGCRDAEKAENKVRWKPMICCGNKENGAAERQRQFQGHDSHHKQNMHNSWRFLVLKLEA